MNETQYDSSLFAELYDVQPQAILWMEPVWSMDGSEVTDFELTYTNEEGLHYLNFTRQQKGLRLSQFPTLTADLREKLMEEMKSVFYSGKKLETDMYNPVLKKHARIMRTKLRGGVLTVIQERTDEFRIIRQLEEKTKQLQDRELLLNNLLQYSPAGISITEVIRNEAGVPVDGRTVLVNKAAEQYLMVPKEVLLSKKVTEIDPNILNTPLYQKSLHTLVTGQPLNIQYYFAPTEKWIELSVSKMDDDHLINIFLDITETKKVQLQIEGATERLQAVFDASQSGMFTFAPVRNEQGEVIDFRFVITNPNFAAYVAQTPQVLQGALGSTYFPGYLHNGVFDMYKHTYLTGEAQRREVHYNVDGHDLYLDLQSTKIQDEVLVTFTDYTTLKQTQLQLEKLVEDLKRSNANLEEFAHAASHDLKEPIRKIRVFSGSLEESLGDRLNEQERRIFERMINATERMTLLVDDLLAYSHISTTPLQQEIVDLNKKINLVLSDLELQIAEKTAIIRIEPLPGVKGYRRQLQQLFQNLIGNALKYSKEGITPEIIIRAGIVTGAAIPLNLPEEYTGKEYHLIEVQDNGIGFEQQYAERIFQMFQRLWGKTEYSGTGIGLSIARKVVENHKGYIWAKSEPGNGATFFVALPV